MQLGSQAKADPLDRIRGELLAADLVRCDAALARALEPQRDYLTDNELELYRRGRGLRPTLLLLSARLLHGDAVLPDRVIQAAVSLEMLHVATLIHDDIVDEAPVRRGVPSVNATRGTQVAVLVGDLQFVQAIRGFVGTIEAHKDMGLVQLVLDSAFRICCGELDELSTDPGEPTELLTERYMRTIERKTAVLFGLACEAGAALVDAHAHQARRIGFYGRRLGRAFQIMDDLLDLVTGIEVAGKAIGTDLARGRLSLPLIYAIAELGPAHEVTRALRGAPCSPDELAGGVAAVRHSASFTRAYDAARAQALDALEYLEPFARSRYRDALEELVLFVVDRSF